MAVRDCGEGQEEGFAVERGAMARDEWVRQVEAYCTALKELIITALREEYGWIDNSTLADALDNVVSVRKDLVTPGHWRQTFTEPDIREEEL